MTTVPPLMLLDTASLYFRAFYGVPQETNTAPDGTPVNAVRGLLDMIARLVRARHPGRLVACLEGDWRPAFRVAAIPSYKSHRSNPDGSEQMPDALAAQIPVILQVLAAAGVAMAAAGGYEADDAIGALAARDDGSPVEVVTGDRDLFQVVDDAREVRVLYVGRGVANLEVIDEAAISARYGIPGGGYAAFAALRGDPSDGLPGVPGVGEKTAAALIRAFGTVQAMLAAIDAGHGGFPAGTKPKLVAARSYLEAALPVVEVATGAPVAVVGPQTGWLKPHGPRRAPDGAAERERTMPSAELGGIGALPARPADPASLARLDQRWDLGSSLGRMTAALAARPA
jgi:5'-3' exonuclease